MTDLYGLDIGSIPDGHTPLEAVVVLKCLDEEGDVTLFIQSTDNVRAWESAGMLLAALDVQRDHLREGFRDG